MQVSRRAIVLQHVPFEGPARLAALFEERGCGIEVLRLDLGADVPSSLSRDAGDVLIVMGGPMGLGDVERVPFLRRELQLLERCIADDVPVLGVCLGAQLLAHAAGAPVTPMVDAAGARAYELGWGPIDLQRTAADDPILGDLPDQAWVLHWHGDTFALPRGARRLASTPVCANQAFQLGQRQFGLQFHCEVAPEHVEKFLHADAPFVERALGPSGAKQVQADTERHAAPAWQTGHRLLTNILDSMLRAR